MTEKLPLSLCDFNKKTTRLLCASEYFAGGFPREIDVVSHYTGTVVKFKPVQPGHPEWDEDGWDGEQCVYAPVENVPNVKTLTVYHQW